MKAKKIVKAVVAAALICAFLVNACGCAVKVKATDLMEGIEPQSSEKTPAMLPGSASRAADFAVRLFKHCGADGKNTLISPLSVLSALAMTLNGAKGETKKQMETALGMGAGELNDFFKAYMQALPNAEKYKLSLANSIWFKDDGSIDVDRGFLQTNADYFGAGAFKAPFDGGTLKDINGWVEEHTDGMIEDILDNIPGEAVMYLVNALAFEADWERIYESGDVRKGEFTLENGEKQTAEFMYSTESKYLEDGSATGFIKYYSGHKYAFAALLPNEGVSVSEYLASLDGKALHDMLAQPQNATVKANVPKFKTEYDTEMSDILKAMGMTDAFDIGRADFSGLGYSKNGNIYVSRVIHKTFISVDEKGTRAGAATAVEMGAGSAYNPDIKTVCLDRPFVYMLIDTRNSVPFFIGTMMDVNG